MKVQDILIFAASVRGVNEPAPQQQQVSIRYLNILLQDCFTLENSIRRNLGIDVLASAPMVVDVNDDIEYQDSVTRTVLPFGLAECLYRLEGDSQAECCLAMYQNNKQTAFRSWMD